MSWDHYLRQVEVKTEQIIPTDVVTWAKLPTNIFEWIDVARPIVDGHTRVILPMWEEIYRDPFPFKMVIGGRQIFKSTYTTDILAHETTAYDGVQVGYVTYDDISRSGFAKQRLQYGTFEPNLKLKAFIRHKLGSVREISLKNGSTIYTFIDHGQYSQVEGKSLVHTMLDEAQYQDIENVDRVILAMTTTQGKLTVLGVGGEAGSAYEKLFKQTDQRYWVFDDPLWREKLRFGFIKEKGKWGFLWTDPTYMKDGKPYPNYLYDIMKGHWEVPEHARGNTMFHGYWLPQTIFPHIPLTIAEAMDPQKYNVHPRFSIEWKEQNLLARTYKSHVMGSFYIAERRPITEELVRSCMDSYKGLGLLTPGEIADLKATFGNRIKISLGVDWGSGNPSFTVVSIIIEWLGTNGGPSRFQLAYYDKRPKEDQMKQAENVLKLFKDAACDIGVGDLGHGANQVKFIQDGGFSHFNGAEIEGLGSRIFVGCRSNDDATKPVFLKEKHIDEHGTQLAEFRIDKHSKIQDFINLMGAMTTHPLYPNDQALRRSKIMFPFIESGSYKQQPFIDDLCKTTRKDIEKLEERGNEPDPTVFPHAQFNHPSDTLMSMIYAMIGFEKKSYNWFSV